MVRLKRCFRFITTTFIFMFAFYTTFTAITNVSAHEVLQATSTIRTEDLIIASQPQKDLALDRKSAMVEAVNQNYYASKHDEVEQVEQPTSIEDVIDFSQYPTVTVTATGYTAGYESTGKTPDHPAYGITYSGLEVTRDLYSTIAADLSIFPLGTIIYIPDYGYGVVADIGGAIKGHKLDLYYPTVEEVYENWGKREVEVYIIEEGNGEITSDALKQLNETEDLQVFRQDF